jgi:hypothetical protein
MPVPVPPALGLLPLLALPGSTVAVLDERAWLDELVAHRGALMMQHEGTMQDPAYWALVIKPKYRAELLTSPTATWDSILTREYTDALRASDRAWAESLRVVERAVQPTATLRSFSNLDQNAGYGLGTGAPYDAAGLHYKVFYDFTDFQKSLTGERVLGFAKELDRRGFQGDFKIGLTPGTRYIYNDIILHAPSIAMGLCAEAVGLAWFGSELDHIARGLDVVVRSKPYDWHHYLLTGWFDQLPADAKDYVGYRVPVPEKVCPDE